MVFSEVLTTLTVLSLVVLSLLSTPSIQSSASSAWPMFHGNAQHTGLSPFSGPSVPFLRWTFQTGGPVDASPAIGHGRIYVTSEDGNLYALNTQGHLLWKFHTPCHGFEFGATTPAISSDGTIYFASQICGRNPSGIPNGVLYAINPGGKQKWNFTNPNPGEGVDSFTSPTIGPDGTIYVSDVGFRIFAFNPDGTVKWQVATAGEVVGPPALARDGTAYVPVDDPGPPSGACVYINSCLVALNADGSIRWTKQGGGFSSPAVGSDGTVYDDGRAVSPNGTVQWENRPFRSPSISADGTIYGTASTYPNNFGLFAIGQDGTVKWEFVTGNYDQSSVAIGSNGILYFGSGNSLYAVAPNGTLVWQFVIHPTIFAPAIGSNGTIYVGSNDGNLYAIG